MPIYRQTYRHYSGRMRRRFRWLVVVEQEVRVLVKSKIFLALVLLALVHFMLRVFQVVAYDVVMQDPNNPLTPVLIHIQGIVVNGRMFFDFIRLQGPLVLLVTLYAGAGMICNDFRHNLMEVYFSKPIRWYDYALGKSLTLIFLGLALTALPALFLLVQHNLLLPSWPLFRETIGWAWASVAFSLLLVAPCALAILASSALMQSQNYAAVAIIMLLVANSIMGGLLATLLREQNYLIASLPFAVNRVGQQLFGDSRLYFDLHWGWALLYVAVVVLGSAWIVFRRVRRTEVAL